MKRMLCVAVVLLLLLTGCSATAKKTKYSTQSFDYFDTVSIITGYAESQQGFDAVAQEVLTQLEEYHRLYTIYHRFEGMENLCTVNELVDGAHRTVTVDRRIIDLLVYAKQMYELTDGRMNVAMGSVLSLWHDARTLGKDDPSQAALPSMTQLEQAARHTDMDAVVIDEENCTVTLTDPQMTLDVGALAKGYATERIARSLEEKGIGGYVLNIGGNVRTVGPKPDGEGWTVGVENPDGDGYLAYLSLSGQSLVTSGSYQRYYVVDGKRYHHIIHPETLMPAEGFVSVSVVCNDSGLADALSTALFCLPRQEGLALVESVADAQAMWVGQDGEVFTSSGWDRFVKE